MSWGFVIVILRLLPDLVNAPRVMLSHPGIGVGVLVGVKVGEGVRVIVGVLEGVNVGVIVGVLLGVLVGSGVFVITGPAGCVAVGVSVGVLVGVFVGVLVGVFVGTGPGPPPPGTELCPVVILRMPRKVRALDAVIGRGSIGIRFSMGR